MAALGLAVTVGGCGRSEDVGWSDRDQARGQASRESVDERSRPPRTIEEVEAAYSRLAGELATVRERALEDSTVRARWAELNARAESRMADADDFLAALIERRNALEQRLGGGRGLSRTERARLQEQYQNIRKRLGQEKRQVFVRPEFARGLRAFQDALYRAMREMAPEQRAKIDTMEALGERLYQALDSLTIDPGSDSVPASERQGTRPE